MSETIAGNQSPNEGSNAVVTPQQGISKDSSSVERPAWIAQLPNELKEDVTLSRFKTIGDMGKAFLEAEGKLKTAIQPLGEKATDEERKAYYKSLGIPENPDGYEIKRPEKLPEGMHYSESLEAGFKETAHKLGLTPSQVKGLFEFYNTYEINNYENINKFIQENREKSVNTLKNIWKGNTYEENRTKATRTFFDTIKKMNPPQELGGAEGITKEFNESGFGDNPAMLWYFSKLFDLVSIDSFGQSSPPSGINRKPGMLDFSKSMPQR